MLNTQSTQTRRRTARRSRGAVMVETVLILPFIMVMIVLIIYLGWNFRRAAQVTNMDRYAVWEEVTPGAPGPDTQRQPDTMRNPRLNAAFYGLNGDLAETLDEHRDVRRYVPQGHEDLRDSQADETYSYYDEFLERNRAALYERFSAEHEHIADLLESMNMSELTRNSEGHSRMDGDWRYVNGVRLLNGQWRPAGYRVTPGQSLREVFYAEFDDGLEPYTDNNRLADAIQRFYLAYPNYIGPDINVQRLRNQAAGR